MRYFIYLAYDGTNYHGWQIQPNGASVQETLMKALSTFLRKEIEIVGAGRTDAGVHAKCYVANFRTTSTIPVDRLPYALNTHLPADIVVTKAFDVHEDFNAKLAENFPDLTQQEKRLAALLRLGFSSKYIATLMNITPKSVEISRYRLRQKLGLTRGDNLVNFIKSI